MMSDSTYKEESSITSEDDDGVDAPVDTHMEGVPQAVAPGANGCSC